MYLVVFGFPWIVSDGSPSCNQELHQWKTTVTSLVQLTDYNDDINGKLYHDDLRYYDQLIDYDYIWLRPSFQN